MCRPTGLLEYIHLRNEASIDHLGRSGYGGVFANLFEGGDHALGVRLGGVVGDGHLLLGLIDANVLHTFLISELLLDILYAAAAHDLDGEGDALVFLRRLLILRHRVGCTHCHYQQGNDH